MTRALQIWCLKAKKIGQPQISRFGAGLLDVTSREIPRRSAESARLSGGSASLVAWQSRLRPGPPQDRRLGAQIWPPYPLRHAHATGMTGQAAETVRQRLTLLRMFRLSTASMTG
jgi:hypothetical protein